ncbi:hypothetical protein T492DRAFT_1078856 [Pavlovales sp. CCMP2436]|nr:hypothetical protein T492DRAFT_1078856 [Pavlovales sp. CCMP2436]|mmetsp:Transcript_42764/g.99082  ORF Transcript_42764/g.99082 Transcript_42764/m.99082 type:complete len:300 (+) Transcript_42764:91-990(+)
MDYAQFVLAGGAGPSARTLTPGQRPPRELLDYHNRMSLAHEHGASIPAYSGRFYSLAKLSIDHPRDAKSLSVFVPGARQTYGLGYEETLSQAKLECAEGPEALDWPVPFGTRERAVEGYTGHVPLAGNMIGLTTAERVPLSERRIAEGKLMRPESDPRHEPASQPHAGFPYKVQDPCGLAVQRQGMIGTQHLGAELQAQRLREKRSVLVPAGATSALAAGARIHAYTTARYAFGDDDNQIGPHLVLRNTYVTALAPAPMGSAYSAQARARPADGSAVMRGAAQGSTMLQQAANVHSVSN